MVNLYKHSVVFLTDFVFLYELFEKPIFCVDADKFCDIIIARYKISLCKKFYLVGDYGYVC